MRAIFSQCFNTSQLASVLGRSPPPPSPPRQQLPGQPHPTHAAATSASLFISLFQHSTSQHPQNCSPVRRKQTNQSSIKGPEANIRKSRAGKHSSPFKHPHFSPGHDWLGQCRGGEETHGQANWTAGLSDPASSVHCQAWETKLSIAPLAHFLYPFQNRGSEDVSESGTKDSGQELSYSRKRVTGRANSRHSAQPATSLTEVMSGANNPASPLPSCLCSKTGSREGNSHL